MRALAHPNFSAITQPDCNHSVAEKSFCAVEVSFVNLNLEAYTFYRI